MQAVPGAQTERLNSALARLARNPRDGAALVDAADAARILNDYDAAIGFYRRADEIMPENPRIKSGLAAAMTLSGDPVSAIPMFADAEKAGANPAQLAAERGLAYDLVGANATAQRYYRAALNDTADDEVRMRLAISQAISGNLPASDVTLSPLIQKQDKPGWRTRAFILAISGDTPQAVSVANTILPQQLAQNIAPYLRYMPRLTRAQQAAAANLGRFPRASEIGRDDPRIAAYALRLAAAEAALAPKGAPVSGSKSKSKQNGRSRTTVKPQTASVPAKSVAIASTKPEPPQSAEHVAFAPHVPPLAPAIRQASPADVPRVAPPEPKPEKIDELPAARVGTEPATALASAAKTPVSTPAPLGPPPQPGARQLSLDQIFADIGKPAVKVEPAAGAVDIRAIEPARPVVVAPKPESSVASAAASTAKAAPAKPKKPAPPAHPSRIWVQIGVGRDEDAIAFDWRRNARKSPALFKGRQPSISDMGRTNRILVGPFATKGDANSFIVDAKKAGFEDLLPWTSEAGQVVEALSVK